MQSVSEEANKRIKLEESIADETIEKEKEDSQNINNFVGVEEEDLDKSDNIPKPRLWVPYIESYELEDKDEDLVIKAFINKIETLKKNKIYHKNVNEDAFYFSYKEDVIKDPEELLKDEKIKQFLECKQLRIFSLNLISTLREMKFMTEKLIRCFYNVKKMDIKENEEVDKFFVLCQSFVIRKRRMIGVLNKIRERMNTIYLNAEDCWNFLKVCNKIANKKIKK